MCKISFLLFLAFLVCQPEAMAQKRVLSAEEFFAMLSNGKGDTLRLDSVKIVRGENIDLHLLPGSMTALPVFEKQIQSLDTLHIYKLIDLRSVELDWDFSFHKIRFHHNVWLENCTFTRLFFNQCRFDSTVIIGGKPGSDRMYLRKSVFSDNVDISNVKKIEVSECRFFDRNYISGNVEAIYFRKSWFEILRPDRSVYPAPTSLSLRGITNQNVRFEIFSCQFIRHGGELGLDFFSINFGYLNFQHSDFEVPIYWYLTQLNQCIVEHCRFGVPMDFREIGLPATNTNFPFEQLSGRIGVKDTFVSNYKLYPKLYKAADDPELQNPSNYNELIAVYSKLLATYKYRGDQKSYNACYVEMKDIAARKARFDYLQNPTLEGFFEWRLARFLKTFCDYGTSPVKSLLFSFYVILAFAALYFLFPSEDDNVSKRSLSRFISSAVDYFKTDKQLLDFQVEKQEAELQIMRQLGEKLEQAKQGTPGILLWIGRPFYAWVSVYHRFMIWFYNRTDLVKGQWSKLSSGRRLWLGILVSGYFLFFVLSGLLVRVLNALALSLNVFVTLGYGEISARGAMRYFAVLEGLLGWFLLSIFSVSLIGQVLQ